jgi:ferredoxin-NADP reductase
MKLALTLRVQEVRFLADRVLGLTLVDPTGAALPAWSPGAHIDVQLPSGATRSYSLCGEPDVDSQYDIAILRSENGRGGSAEIHDSQLVGKQLSVSAPRNSFELIAAPHYVFIAGGIGITPLLPMLRAVTQRPCTWEMHYLGRERSAMAFLPEVQALANDRQRASGRISLDIVSKAEGRMLDVAQCVGGAPDGAAVYCCGPESLLQAVEASQAPRRTLHLERFGRPTLALDSTGPTETTSLPPMGVGDDATPCDPNGAFQVVLQRTGVTVQVPADRSILEVVRETRRDLTFSCSSGYCGTCETRVIQGVPDHRDEVLDGSERAANKSMMICVSRSLQTKLVLDL